MDEAAGEGEQPDDGEDDGQAGDDFGVDEAALVPAGGSRHGMEPVARQAGHNGGKGQLVRLKSVYGAPSIPQCGAGFGATHLREAEDHGDEIDQNHLGGFIG